MPIHHECVNNVTATYFMPFRRVELGIVLMILTLCILELRENDFHFALKVDVRIT